jgi:ribonuclease-3
MRLLKKLSIKPINPSLYEQAFIHESYSYEHNLEGSYERLEFIGDAVLDLIVSEFLYKKDSNLTEGELTRLRANYVCKQALYTYSMELSFDKYIKLGSGLELSEREINSIISDVFESFIGALYLDLGLDSVKEFIVQTVLPHIISDKIFFYDYKSELKELCDKEGYNLVYELLNEEGPPHNKTFSMAALVNGKQYSAGNGGSKKEAEQYAAKLALNKL